MVDLYKQDGVDIDAGDAFSRFCNDINKETYDLSKFVRITNLFDPLEIMMKCAEWRGMKTEDCYKTWNGGQGAIVVVDPD